MLAALDAGTPPGGLCEQILAWVEHWIQDLNPADASGSGDAHPGAADGEARVLGVDGWNTAQVIGQALCVLFHAHNIPVKDTPPLTDLFGANEARINVTGKDHMHEMTWREVSDVVTALQHEFAHVFQFEDGRGFCSDIDVEFSLACVMKHVGLFLGSEWSPTECEEADVVGGILECASDGRVRVAQASACDMLNVLHVLMNLSRLLKKAVPVPATSDGRVLDMHNNHREASLDDFYYYSMIVDLVPGAIVQYQQQFRHLFHSVSQVIYFHYPSYHRRKQLGMHEIRSRDAQAEHLLPLLLQLHPTVPIFCEHTGMGLWSVHSKQKFSFVLCSHFCLLVEQDMKVFCAHSVQDLCLYLDSNL